MKWVEVVFGKETLAENLKFIAGALGGKKNDFKALIYMHRYQSDLLAYMRTDYVHEQRERYRTQLKHIGDAMDSTTERVDKGS